MTSKREKDKENCSLIYSEYKEWLKFIEAKIVAFLTIESGLFFFLIKILYTNEVKGQWRLRIISGLFLMALAMLMLIKAFIPGKVKSSNILNYESFRNNEEKNFVISSNDYEEQIRDISKVICRKVDRIRMSIKIFISGLVIFVLGLVF